MLRFAEQSEKKEEKKKNPKKTNANGEADRCRQLYSEGDVIADICPHLKPFLGEVGLMSFQHLQHVSRDRRGKISFKPFSSDPDPQPC